MDLNPIEKEAIEEFRRRSSPDWPSPPVDERAEWLRFGLFLLSRAGAIVRNMRLGPLKKLVRIKTDRTPVTLQEEQKQSILQKQVSRNKPDKRNEGEETGGKIQLEAKAVDDDPIDGTWAINNRM